MARQCIKLEVGDVTVKLRLTLKGQKALREKYPEDSVLTTIMEAVDDPEAMDLVLTQALRFDGSGNKIRSGEELYDLLVDNGYEGQEDFMALMMDIAKNAGLVTQDDRDKLGRVVSKQIRNAMDRLESALDEPETLEGDEEGEEGPENPLRTLDG
jgi:hypothetical protein